MGDIDKALTQPVDFFEAINLASRHGLAPCVIQQLQQHAPAALPESVAVEFRRWLRAHTLRSMQLTAQLFQILDRLKDQGIRALAFKGPVLAQELYDQPFSREFVDLDILVPMEAAGQVIALLGAAGFEAQFRLSPRQLIRFQQNWCEMGLYDRARDILVEIHWQLFPPGYSFSPAAENAWKETREVLIAQRSVTTLSIENQLLLACLHQAKHNWSRLGWIRDLAALIKKSPHLNWQDVQHSAGRFGTARMIGVSLQLIQNLIGVPLPSAIREWAARDQQSENIAQRVEQHLLSADSNAGVRRRTDPFFRAAMESKCDRVRYWHSIFRPTPLEWELVRLPDWLSGLYYPIRAGRLLLKHAARSSNAP